MKIFSIINIFILMMTTLTVAQSFSTNFSIAFPQGEFKEKIENVGIGLNGDFMFLTPKPKYPYGIGLNLSFYVYGSESRHEPLSTNIPDVYVRVDRTNGLSNFHLLFKLGIPDGIFRPYLEGLFGGSYIATTTSIKTERREQELATSTNFEDYAWSYGAGFGASYLIYIYKENNESNNLLFLDFKTRYLFGTEAEYLKQGSVKIQNGKVYYDVSKSKTDLLSVHLGIKYYFSWRVSE